MRIYPDIRAQRRRALGKDATTVLLIVAFAWLGLTVHDVVDKVAVLGGGVRSAGDAVQSGFRSAGDAVGGTPLVGGGLRDALRSAGAGTGGNVAEAGRDGEESVHHMANLLGALVFGLPTLALLWAVVPGRIREVRGLRSAEQVLAEPLRGPDVTEESRRAVAMRAAFSLPYEQLLRYTNDPLGDLVRGSYDPLVTAALETSGLSAKRVR